MYEVRCNLSDDNTRTNASHTSRQLFAVFRLHNFYYYYYHHHYMNNMRNIDG